MSLKFKHITFICLYVDISVIRAGFITSAWFHHQIKAPPYLVLQLTHMHSQSPKFDTEFSYRWVLIFLNF